jgi:5-methylcytosine-specific restriction endonuclease McrA
MKRNQIFERDGYRCVYCGEQFAADELTLDHVEPRVRGGDRSEGNLVTACMGCNTRKGHRRLSQFLHENPEARRIFHERATQVWPRLLRLVDAELAQLDKTQ